MTNKTTECLSIYKTVKKMTQKRFLVIGEVMLDEYYHGVVKRISPEAPVPIFLKTCTEYRLGGAANVAMNIAVNNMHVTLLSVVGNDENGRELISLCEKYQIETGGIVKINRPTCSKLRLLASNNQQVLRIDEEDTRDVDTDIERLLIQRLKILVNSIDIIIISDYMKGLLTPAFMKNIIKISESFGIKVLIDAKDPNAEKYKGAYLIKPNKNELAILTNMPVNTNAQFLAASNKLLDKCKSQYILTTLGADGMLLVEKSGYFQYYKAMTNEVFDVTGAGDTVIAYMGMSIANDIPIVDAVNFANIAAGIQVSKVGTSPVRFSELLMADNSSKYNPRQNKRLGTEELNNLRTKYADKIIVFTNGCFDILHVGHLRYLKQASSLGDILVVGVNNDASIQRLKGNKRPINTEIERLEMLESYDFIDYLVLFGEDTPCEVIKRLNPNILVKGGDYKPEEVVGREVVEEAGGQVVILPFVEGKSTTKIIDKIMT